MSQRSNKPPPIARVRPSLAEKENPVQFQNILKVPVLPVLFRDDDKDNVNKQLVL